MIITEQKIKQIILEELLLEQKIFLKENLFKNLIDKFLNKPKNVSVDEYAKNLEKNYSIDSDTLKQTQDAYKEINFLINQGVDPKEAKKIVITREIENIRKLSGFSDNDEQTRDASSVKPPPPPEDDENSEKNDVKDIAPDDDSDKNTSKFSKLARQVAGNSIEKQKQIEALLTFLEKSGHLKPEALKKISLLESLIKKFYGNNNMSIDKKALKTIIKEEVEKQQINELISGLKALAGKASNVYRGGEVQTKIKNTVSNIATQTDKLSQEITKLKMDAEKLNLQTTKELKNIVDSIADIRDNSKKLSSGSQQLLVPKDSPEASSDGPTQTNSTDNVGGISAGAAQSTTPVGGTVKSFGKEYSGAGPEGGLGGVAATDTSTGASDKQQARRDKASQTAQSANKNQTQSPEVKNLQSIINSVRNPAKDTNTIMASKPILARLGAAGFTPQQSKKVVELFKAFLTDKVKKTSKGSQISITEQEQAQAGHNNLRVFDNSNRSVMGRLIAIMKQVLQDQSLGKPTKEINDTVIANLAKELAKDIANQARVSAGLTIDPKDRQAGKAAAGTDTKTAETPPSAPATAPSAPSAPATAPSAPSAPATAPSAPATAPSAPSAPATGTEAPKAEPDTKQTAAPKKKLSEMPKGQSAGKVLTDFFNQFQDDEEFKSLNINANKAKESVNKIATVLGIKASDLLAENKLNEHLISRNKKSNNSLTSEQVERMKLLAGIKK